MAPRLSSLLGGFKQAGQEWEKIDFLVNSSHNNLKIDITAFIFDFSINKIVC